MVLNSHFSILFLSLTRSEELMLLSTVTAANDMLTAPHLTLQDLHWDCAEEQQQ